MPFTSCCAKSFTAPPGPDGPKGRAPKRPPLDRDESGLLERVGLLRDPLLALDAVDGQDLGRGVAVRVERDLAGDAGDGDLPDLVDRGLAYAVVDLALAGQRLRQRLDDDVGRVVRVGAVRAERLGVAPRLVRGDEVL